MSKLTERGKGINFDDMDDATTAGDREKPRTAIGAISASLAMGRGVEAENRRLKQELEKFEDATFVEFLDPRQVVPSRFANRHELSFVGPEFLELKEQIRLAGRNVQPIKVRRAGSDDAGHPKFEIVFGHRRHRACLDLGLPVAALVEDVSDVELFAQMDRENRGRENLSAWEQGMMYKRALELGLFPSQRQLATAIGVQSGNVSTAIQLASLPPEVVAAFGSPLELQFRWGAALKAALDKDAEGVVGRAREIAALPTRPSPRETLARLLDAARHGRTASFRQFMNGGSVAATWEKDGKGALLMRVKSGALSPVKEKKLLDFLERLFD